MPSSYFEQNHYRVFTAFIGLLIGGVGIYSALHPITPSFVGYIISFILFVLGYNALWSAYHAKESWLSKLGPLP